MKKVIAVLSPVALSLALFALPASAGKGPGAHHGLHGILKQLDLTEQQKQDIRQTFSQSRQDKQVYREDMRGLREEIRAYIQTDSWNEAAIRELLSQQEHLLASLKLQKAQNRNKVWNLLDAEQQGQWQSIKQERKARHAEAKKTKKGRNKLDKLNLSDEQLARVEQLQADKQAQKQVHQTEYQAFRQAQQAIIQAESFDQAAWQQLWQQNQPLLVNIAVSKAKYRHDIWNVLTTQQQQEFTEMQDKRMSRKKHRG